MEKIAVILPVYRGDRVAFFSKAVESILFQTYRCFHLFVGVDGPVDKEMDDYLIALEKQNYVTVVRFVDNRGMTAVLNDLIKMANKEDFDFIARMDADDISMSDRFEKQIHFLNSHKDVDVVGGAIKRIDTMGTPHEIKKYPLTHDECYKRFAKRNPLSHPAVMFKKSFFIKLGGFYRSEYRTNQDTMLWFDGFKNGIKMANIPDVVLEFRVTDDMLGSRRGGWKRAKKQLDTRLMINKGLGYGIKSDIYAYLVCLYMVLPVFIKKIIYKTFK